MIKKILLIVVLVVALRIPSLYEPDWYTDEAIYLTVGNSLNNGQSLYRDIADNKPPFLYKLSQLSGSIFNLKLSLLFWSIATCLIFFFISKHQKLSFISALFFIFATSTPLFEGNIANGEIFMMLPILCSLYLLNKNSKQDYLIAGFVAGFSLLIKYTSLFDIIALSLLVYLNTSSLKSSVKFFIFSHFLFFATTFSFAIKGDLFFFIKNVIINNFGYLNSWATGDSHSSILNPVLFLKFIAMVFSVFFFYKIYLLKKISKQTLFLFSWLILAFFSIKLSGRPYPHYYLQLVPPLTIILFNLAVLKKYSNLIMGLFLLYLLFDIQYKINKDFYQILPYYKNFLNKNNPSYYPKDTATIYYISNYLSQNTPKNSRLLAWSNDPQFYYLSNRLPVYKYFTVFMVNDWGNQLDLTTSIQAFLPTILVDKNNNLPGFLLEIIQKYYQLNYNYKNYLVYTSR